MALKFTGTGTRSGGIYDAIKKQLNILSLEPAKRIVFKFDPFTEGSYYMRHFLYILNSKQPWTTNPYCKIKTEIVCNRSDPSIDVFLNNGESVLFKCKHLNHLDMIKLFNKYISVLAPKPEAPAEVSISTKVTKKATKKK